MIVRINGKVVNQEPTPPAPKPDDTITAIIKKLAENGYGLLKTIPLMALLPPPNCGALTIKLWPLVGKLCEFGLVVGIGMSMWGLVQWIMGDPSGKQKIWQAVIGFVGLFVIPEVFFAIWGAFN